MNNMKNLLLLAGVVGGYFLIMILAKNIYSGKLANAMAKGESEKAKKLLFSNAAIFLLNHQMLSMMRASFCVSEERYDEAARYCGMIKTNKLSIDQLMSYYVIKMQVALGRKDNEMAEQIQEELRSQNEIYERSDINDMIEDNKIQIALTIAFNPEVIDQLNVRVKTCKNKDEKGLLLINLAKAYHLNQQNEEARTCLKRAKEYVTNELTLQLIDAALKDIHVLD